MSAEREASTALTGLQTRSGSPKFQAGFVGEALRLDSNLLCNVELFGLPA